MAAARPDAAAEITRVREWLAGQGRDDVPFTVFGADTDDALLDGFAEAGVDEVTLRSTPSPRATRCEHSTRWLRRRRQL